jgi:hypothetical protein
LADALDLGSSACNGRKSSCLFIRTNSSKDLKDKGPPGRWAFVLCSALVAQMCGNQGVPALSHPPGSEEQQCPLQGLRLSSGLHSAFCTRGFGVCLHVGDGIIEIRHRRSSCIAHPLSSSVAHDRSTGLRVNLRLAHLIVSTSPEVVGLEIDEFNARLAIHVILQEVNRLRPRVLKSLNLRTVLVAPVSEAKGE